MNILPFSVGSFLYNLAYTLRLLWSSPLKYAKQKKLLLLVLASLNLFHNSLIFSIFSRPGQSLKIPDLIDALIDAGKLFFS